MKISRSSRMREMGVLSLGTQVVSFSTDGYGACSNKELKPPKNIPLSILLYCVGVDCPEECNNDTDINTTSVTSSKCKYALKEKLDNFPKNLKKFLQDYKLI
jgi:hypothetical protein